MSAAVVGFSLEPGIRLVPIPAIRKDGDMQHQIGADPSIVAQ